MTFLRSLLFNVGFYVGSATIAILGLPLLLAPRRWVLAWARLWGDFTVGWATLACGITWRVRGRERLPAGPMLIAAKHQSTWETLAFVGIFPGAAIVLKRELLYIPIVGQAMARAGSIAVARSAGASALRGMVRDAKAAVADGRPILIFPEGTRTPVGGTLPYHAGIVALYRQLGVPVVPVALNSGLFWPRRKFLKRAGRIDVEILDPIPPGLDRDTFMATLRERIETATARLVAEAPSKYNH